jgi:hypothetical protein
MVVRDRSAWIQCLKDSPLDAQLAVSAAEASAQFQLPMADAAIYACAHALALVTCAAHFSAFAGVEYLQKRAARAR